MANGHVARFCFLATMTPAISQISLTDLEHPTSAQPSSHRMSLSSSSSSQYRGAPPTAPGKTATQPVVQG